MELIQSPTAMQQDSAGRDGSPALFGVMAWFAVVVSAACPDIDVGVNAPISSRRLDATAKLSHYSF
jgi:hypothetical protein